ncbi:MAG: DUF3782 domain-containing protein [Magnetococcales bacterium]|nr:DUF3782 domain-containing protein [Magnetococcales bacterium]
MSQTLTVDDIWKLFQETNRIFKESEARSKESAARLEHDLQETRRIMRENHAETERIMREIRENSAESERKMRENSAEVERKMRESHAETDRVVKEVSRQVGQLGSRWGEFVEGLVAPACETIFAERGIPIHKVSPRIKAKLPGNRHMEIDLLVMNTSMVALVEVKSKLKHDHVREHLTRLTEFKEFFPEYADRRVMGAVAGIVIEESVDRYAMNEGLFVIVQSGDAVHLANDTAFQPRIW